MSKEYRRLLEAAYPEATWPVLARGAAEAIKIADTVRQSTPFLSTRVGRDLRGLMRRAAIMWRYNMLCASKELPFSAEEIVNPYTNGTSHLLRLRSGKIDLHVVRTDEPEAFPVDAQIRQDHRTSNQPDFFRDGKLIPLHGALESVPLLDGWIMWRATGRGELTHFALGMPDPKENVWLTYIDVLTRVKATEAAPDASIEKSSKPDPTLLLKFKEEIARALEQESSEQDASSNDNTA